MVWSRSDTRMNRGVQDPALTSANVLPRMMISVNGLKTHNDGRTEACVNPGPMLRKDPCDYANTPWIEATCHHELTWPVIHVTVSANWAW
jgi:hypothetical protein